MIALIALGANLHNGAVSPLETLQKSVHDIEKAGFFVEKISRMYRTPAFPKGAGPDYVNAALQVKVASTIAQNAVFFPLAQVELAHGRARVQRWGGRTLDIDVLALGDLVHPNLAQFRHWAGLEPALQAQIAPQELIVPHPRMHERAFVLVPLMDIAPDWLHPVFGRTVREMHDALPPADRASVVAI